MLIWIVEDDMEFAEHFERLIRGIDSVSDVRVFYTAESLLESAKAIGVKEVPALIFVDVYLPGSAGGVDLVSTLGDSELRAPCIVMSHSDRAKIIRQAGATRAADFLVKPSSYSPKVWGDWSRDVEASMNFALSKSASFEEVEAKLTTQRLELFYRSVNHDYRQPIVDISTRIRELRAELVRGAAARPKKLNASVRSIEIAVSRSLDVVAELEAVVGDGRFAVNPTTIKAASMKRSILARWGEHFDGLDVDCAPDVKTMSVDVRKLNRAIDNILNNSVKFRNEVGSCKARVTIIRCQDDEDFFKVIFEDWGIGIPPSDRTRVFLPGARASNVGQRFPGYGRGLALVKLFVEAHKDIATEKIGTCWISDPTDHQGTILTIRLPLRSREILVDPIAD